jgi:hypothetical protein
LPGQWWNTITESASDSVEFVAAITDHAYIQWVPRDEGGGFRGRHAHDSKIVRDAIDRNGGKMVGRLPVPQPPDAKGKSQPDHELTEAFEVWAVLCDGKDAAGMAVISFQSMKIKAYKEWNTQLSMFQVKGADGRKRVVPLFAHHVRLSSRSTSNKFGEFYVPVMTPASGELRASLLAPQDPRYLAAKQLREQYHAGVVRAAYETTEREEGGGGGGSDAEAETAF